MGLPHSRSLKVVRENPRNPASKRVTGSDGVKQAEEITMNEDVLKKAMLSYAPGLERDYTEFVRRAFKDMVADLGPTLKGVYNSGRWARIFQGSVRSATINVPLPGAPKYTLGTYALDEAALAKNAKRYGEDVSLQWYRKMKFKLGDLGNVDVSEPGRGGEVIITGNLGSARVRVEQHTIINVSSRGTPFHQFPARIYVDGVFKSEAKYKALTKPGS